MSSIHVCPRSHVPAVLERSGASWVVSALAPADHLPDLDAIAPDRRLRLALSDITEAMPDYVLAQAAHIQELLAFVRRWDREAPLLVHCYAGVSRSTAVAFVTLCCLSPDVSEAEHARRLRAQSPTATPNRRIVALADAILDRHGRMAEAVIGIGRGAECFEGAPFSLSLSDGPTGTLPKAEPRSDQATADGSVEHG